MRILRIDETMIEGIVANMRNTLTKKVNVDKKITYEFDPKLTKPKELKVEVGIEEEAYRKMNALIEECDKEIAWHGAVVREDTGDENRIRFTIYDIFVFPQEVTGATVDTDDTAYAMWLNEFDDETFKALRFHGHSHVRMAVTPSATDMNHRDNLMQNVEDFYIFGVFNKHDSFNLAIYDVENNVIYDHEDIDYMIPVNDAKQWARKQILDNVSMKSVVSPNATAYGGYNYHGYYGVKSEGKTNYGYTGKSAKDTKDTKKDKKKDNSKSVQVDNSYPYGRKNLAEQFPHLYAEDEDGYAYLLD